MRGLVGWFYKVINPPAKYKKLKLDALLVQSKMLFGEEICQVMINVNDRFHLHWLKREDLSQNFKGLLGNNSPSISFVKGTNNESR